MKTIVLDTNELMRDWTLTGLKYQLFERITDPWMDVRVPKIVFEELVANHARAVERVAALGDQWIRQRRQLGLSTVAVDPTPDYDYRSYLTELFDERLGFTVMPWPDVDHRALVARAVSRTPPFDEKGGGYRDALIWTDVVQLVRGGADVALVSRDKAFAGDDNHLVSSLQREVELLPGSVELVRDFTTWLISQLPWRDVRDLAAAVTLSQHDAFYQFYLQSDFQDELEPEAQDLGFTRPPETFEAVEVTWDGEFRPLDGVAADDPGFTLIEYDLGQAVTFTASFPEGVGVEPGWQVFPSGPFRQVQVEGTVDMVVRVAVLFGGEFGFSVEKLSWRRSDGASPGMPPASGPAPDQPGLLDR